jgi:hypothetical protein
MSVILPLHFKIKCVSICVDPKSHPQGLDGGDNFQAGG